MRPVSSGDEMTIAIEAVPSCLSWFTRMDNKGDVHAGSSRPVRAVQKQLYVLSSSGARLDVQSPCDIFYNDICE